MEFLDGKLVMDETEAVDCLAEYLNAFEERGKGVFGETHWNELDGLEKLSKRITAVQILCEVGYLDEKRTDLPYGVRVKWLTPTEV